MSIVLLTILTDLQPAKGDSLGMTDKTNKAEVQ